jgi:hypothetical protein
MNPTQNRRNRNHINDVTKKRHQIQDLQATTIHPTPDALVPFVKNSVQIISRPRLKDQRAFTRNPHSNTTDSRSYRESQNTNIPQRAAAQPYITPRHKKLAAPPLTLTHLTAHETQKQTKGAYKPNPLDSSQPSSLHGTANAQPPNQCRWARALTLQQSQGCGANQHLQPLLRWAVHASERKVPPGGVFLASVLSLLPI